MWVGTLRPVAGAPVAKPSLVQGVTRSRRLGTQGVSCAGYPTCVMLWALSNHPPVAGVDNLGAQTPWARCCADRLGNVVDSGAPCPRCFLVPVVQAAGHRMFGQGPAEMKVVQGSWIHQVVQAVFRRTYHKLVHRGRVVQWYANAKRWASYLPPKPVSRACYTPTNRNAFGWTLATITTTFCPS